MKILSVALLGAMAFQLVAPSKQVELEPKGSIRGVVVRAGSTSPIPGALVGLREGSGGPRASILQAVTTENDGRFVFSAVGTGDYTLTFVAAGYLTQSFGAARNAAAKRGRALADESAPDIVMELTPTATVTGSVRDATGKPLSRVPVHLIRSVYSSSGGKNLEVAMQVMTNDRGEYRMFWIAPGRYYISAGGFTTSSIPTGEEEINRNEVQVKSGRIFYPNTYSLLRALWTNLCGKFNRFMAKKMPGVPSRERGYSVQT